MSSILTNNSAMVALQTLKSINQGLNKTQDEISTGKKVASAKDNSAIWAISKVMESDVKGFKGISESLSVGESTVGVARQAQHVREQRAQGRDEAHGRTSRKRASRSGPSPVRMDSGWNCRPKVGASPQRRAMIVPSSVRASTCRSVVSESGATTSEW